MAVEAKVAEKAAVAVERVAEEAKVAEEARVPSPLSPLSPPSPPRPLSPQDSPTSNSWQRRVPAGVVARNRRHSSSAADAELAKLRRRKPEQEAAAAKAAQRIGEVAAAAEAAPEEERAAAADEDGAWWDQLGGGAIESLVDHTPLLDLEYLMVLAEGGGVMPCGRQNVPHVALITARNLWRLKLWGKAKPKGTLGVLVLPYLWLNWLHLDRLGAQLRRLLPFLKAMLAEAKRDSPHCTVGVMIDFLCLPQKKPFATEDLGASDGARFLVSRKAINGWYFHQSTYTLLMTDSPPEGAAYSNTRLHRDRGWCFFEQAASMVVKDRNCLLDFGAYKGATKFGQYGEQETCLGQMKAGRAAPIAPNVFGERMRARVASGELQFTSNRPSTASPPSPMAVTCLSRVWGGATPKRPSCCSPCGTPRRRAPSRRGPLRSGPSMATTSPRRRWQRCRLAKTATSPGRTPSGWANSSPREGPYGSLPPRNTANAYTYRGASVDWGTPGEARHALKGHRSSVNSSKIRRRRVK